MHKRHNILPPMLGLKDHVDLTVFLDLKVNRAYRVTVDHPANQGLRDLPDQQVSQDPPGNQDLMGHQDEMGHQALVEPLEPRDQMEFPACQVYPV